MNYAPDEVGLVDTTSCANIRAELKMCLLNSDCCKKEKVVPRECLRRTDNTVPEECHHLHTAFFECKRSLMDNRRRFRGVRE